MSTSITRRAKELGLKVEDAKHPLEIDLTKSDIRYGKPQDPERCAFARACRRENQQIRNLWVFKSTAWVETDGKMTRYFLPTSMQKELVAFDRGGSMAAGSYVLRAPAKTQTLQAVKKRSALSRHPKGNIKVRKSVRNYHVTEDVREPG